MSSDEIRALVSEYGERIRAFCRARVQGDDADDLFQECVLALISGYPRFARRSSVSTWVYAVCRNVYSGYIYNRKRDRKLQDELQVRTPAPLPDPDLWRVVERLSQDQQRLYRLYYTEGRSVREIARRLERPEGTIKYLLHELRSSLRSVILS